MSASSSEPAPTATGDSPGPGAIRPDGVLDGGDGREAETEELPEVPEGGIESPAKIIRIGAMVKQLLEEVRSTSLDEAAREQLARIYDSSLDELREALPGELTEELDRLTLDFAEGEIPSEAQLRVAKAQLVGWLEGLFHGIQATLMAQQLAARQQLEGMRGQLPERSGPGHLPGGPGYI